MPHRLPVPSALQTAAHIVRTEGPFALWRGLPPLLCVSLPMSAIYLPLYDLISNTCHDHLGGATPLVAGGIARGVAAFVVAPFELLRTRTQSGTWNVQSNVARSAPQLVAPASGWVAGAAAAMGPSTISTSLQSRMAYRQVLCLAPVVHTWQSRALSVVNSGGSWVS